MQRAASPCASLLSASLMANTRQRKTHPHVTPGRNGPACKVKHICPAVSSSTGFSHLPALRAKTGPNPQALKNRKGTYVSVDPLGFLLSGRDERI